MNIKELNGYSCEEDFIIISISGNDAESFLQGQFSNDITKLDTSTYQVSSYSTNQGKVIAIFRILKVDEEFLIIINKFASNKLMEKLNMYKLASDVVIKQNTIYKIFSVITNNSVNEINHKKTYHMNKKNGLLILNNSNNDLFSYILISLNDMDNIDIIKENSKLNFSVIRMVDMFKGIHYINSETSEKYIPQNLNLSSDIGIDFKKGCYVGQEIIARTHYLGKVKKKLSIIECNMKLKNLEKINNKEGEIIGEIIDDTFSQNDSINYFMIMIRIVNMSDDIYIKDNQIKLINI